MNLKSFFLLAIAVLATTSHLLAQDRIPVTLDEHRLSLNILSPSLQYEYKLNDNQSLTGRAGITWGAHFNYDDTFIDDDFSDSGFDQTLNPFVETTFRNYYSRKRVQKELNHNSGNYIGLLAAYQFDHIAGSETESTQAFYSGAIWGIQRNYKSGIHLGLYLGLGFATGQNVNLTGTGIGGLQLGFVIK